MTSSPTLSSRLAGRVRRNGPPRPELGDQDLTSSARAYRSGPAGPLETATRTHRIPLADAERARALGDATRLTVAAAVSRAEGEELCVCDLSWIAERSEQLVGHHLRILRRAGIVVSRREGKMVLYRLTDQGRALLGAVLGSVHVPR